MSSITFDTLKFATRLEKAGVEREQAEVQAQALAEIFDANLGALATKQDLQLVRKDIDLLEQRMQARFTLLQWMLGMVLGGMISLIIKAFFS